MHPTRGRRAARLLTMPPLLHVSVVLVVVLVAAAPSLCLADANQGASLSAASSKGGGVRGAGRGDAVSESPLVADRHTMALFEVAVAALVGVFAVVFALGARANTRRARVVAAVLQDVLSEQFAQIGTPTGETLLKDGQSCFWFFATGRRYTSGLSVFMDLAKRMDVFAYTSAFLSAPQKDRCVFLFPLTPDVGMEPVSLFVARRKELKRLREVRDGAPMQAVEALAAQVVDGVSGLPPDVVVMTEHRDVATALLPDSVRALITAHHNHLVSIHVTDNGALWEPQCAVSRRMVRVECVLPAQSRLVPVVVEAMARLGVHFVDAAAELKTTPAARAKGLELRKRAVMDADRRAQKRRAEEAAKRREEKKKAEEEAVMKMSRDKQAKYEEKKRKKELTTRMRKASKK